MGASERYATRCARFIRHSGMPTFWHACRVATACGGSSRLLFRCKKRSGYSQEEEQRYPPGRYPRSRRQPSSAQRTLDPLPLSASVQASTSRLSLRCPSRSCEELISYRSGCPPCGRTQSRQIAARPTVMSLRPYLAVIQVRGREVRARCVRRHLPMKPRTRVLSVIAGEQISRYQNVENCWRLVMKAHWDH